MNLPAVVVADVDVVAAVVAVAVAAVVDADVDAATVLAVNGARTIGYKYRTLKVCIK